MDGNMITRHELEYIIKNTHEQGNRKSISGYHVWIKIPNTKLSIIRSTNQKMSFLIEPTYTEILPEKPFADNRYEWRASSEA